MRRAFSSINKLHRRQLGKMNDAWTTDMSVAEITKRATASHPGTLQRKREAPGAVVLGGDFLGLGIVRSLGRKGVAVCVVDDEHSIARFSRFTTCAARVPNLREESRIVGSLLDLAAMADCQVGVGQAQHLSAGKSTWYSRAQNMVLA
jgi:hypothetical protein